MSSSSNASDSSNTFTSHTKPFIKESILPKTDPRSPFYVNLPAYETKPIDDLVNFFKYWKYFIRALISYFKEVALVKEFEANINYQLISAVQFPGCKDLPNKILKELNSVSGQAVTSPPQSQSNTPTKELKKSLSGSSLNSLATTSTNSTSYSTTNGSNNNSNLTTTLSNNELKRPGLFKTKSSGNATFMKATPLHKKTNSFSSTYKSSNPNMIPSNPGSVSGTPPKPPNQFTNDVRIPESFFPEDSLFKNFPAVLLSHHQSTYINNSKLYKDLNTKLIPRLETLLRQVSAKIKEIRSSLKNESFVNPELLKEISIVGKSLNEYMVSIERYNHTKPVLKKKAIIDGDKVPEDEEHGVLDDPFLLKLKVDYQIKSVLIYESYMFASYANLQNIAKDLFTYILKELKLIIDRFGRLNFNNEFFQFLKTKVSDSSNADWEYFISNNPSFLNTYKSTPVSSKKQVRQFKNIAIPYANSIHNKCLRFGILYKKSKLLKSYTRYYYVLTCNYLHEFKFETVEEKNSHKGNGTKSTIKKFINQDDEPIKSYNLNDYLLVNKDEAGFKFQLVKDSHKSTKYSFKCLNANDFNKWVSDLEDLLEFGCKHLERFDHVARRIREQEQEQNQQNQQNQQGQKHATIIEKAATFPSSISNANKTQKHVPKPLNLKHDNNSTASSLLSLPSSSKNSYIGLDGVFTPRIGTPIFETNPFEHTFGDDMGNSVRNSSNQSSLSSPNMSPNESLVNLPNQNPGNQQSNVLDYDSYLKIQQDYIRQQQEVLNLRLKELDIQQQAQQHAQSVSIQTISQPQQSQYQNQFQTLNANDSNSQLKFSPNMQPTAGSLSSPASTESMSSYFGSSNPDNQLLSSKLINSNQNLLRNMEFEGPAIFSLNEENDEESGETASTSSVPTVFVSSDH
ncbi:uncharacterized protein RJT21DRAFT_119765 [Scheffersomyces amazonensis]|uniref:uncharacterized protein n=1 Tax=Scheffersomyces amazonensis TaxID=1078765 RepID=UPI00315C9286